MANPFKDAMGTQKGPTNMMQAFQQFMGHMKGKDPNEMLNHLISSGQINQAQLNQAQQMAQKMAGQFDGFKSMFGF